MIMLCGSIFWGSVIGFVFTGGNLLGGIAGGVVGGILDYTTTVRKKDNYNNTHTDSQQRRIMINSLTDLFMIISGADGVYHENELRSFIDFMTASGFNRAEISMITTRISDFRRNPRDIQIVCRLINSTFNYTTRLVILEMLFRVGLSDGVFSEEEKIKIRQAANLMGIKRGDYFRAREHYFHSGRSSAYASSGSGVDPYVELGVDRNASLSEIKSAYRRLVKKYHPDKVSHLGEEFRRQAEEKMKRINEAYMLLGGRG